MQSASYLLLLSFFSYLLPCLAGHDEKVSNSMKSCSEILWLLFCQCLFPFQQSYQRQFSKGEGLLKLTHTAHNPSLKEVTRTQGRNNWNASCWPTLAYSVVRALLEFFYSLGVPVFSIMIYWHPLKPWAKICLSSHRLLLVNIMLQQWENYYTIYPSRLEVPFMNLF